jgi:hypothetical protein
MGAEGLRSLGVSLSPLGPGQDHIGLPSAAFGADQLLAPIEHWRFGAVPSSHLNGIRLDLMAARSASTARDRAPLVEVYRRHDRAHLALE